MLRIVGWAALVVVAAAIVGCGPAKELPDEEPKGAAPVKQAHAVPAASEAAAKKMIEQAVREVTGGQPDRLAKAKTSRVFAKGDYIYPNGVVKQSIPNTERRLMVVWPDRLQWSYHLKGALNTSVTVWLRGMQIRMREGAVMSELPSPADTRRNILADLYAQHALPLMLPATDPKVVVFDLKETIIAGVPVHTLRFSAPELPLFQLTLDAKSHLLRRVEYTSMEPGKELRTAAVLDDYRLIDGLMVPFTIETLRNGESVEKWKVEKWEFPKSIDDAEFAPPTP